MTSQMETFSALLAICTGIHRSPVNSPHKGQWRGALMFSLICVWINDWVNNHEAGDLRRHRAHYDVTIKKETWHLANTLKPDQIYFADIFKELPWIKIHQSPGCIRVPSHGFVCSWWRNQMETFSALLAICALDSDNMMTSQMETFSALLAICAGNSPVTGEFPTQRASNAELWCFLWSVSE